MLTIFPDLITYSFVATFGLRITLGFIFIWFAYVKYFRERKARIAFFEHLHLRPAHIYFALITGIELIAGIMLVVGLYTQIAALVVAVLMTLATIIKIRKPSALPHNTVEFYILLAVVALVLMFIGPGAFAFDLPL